MGNLKELIVHRCYSNVIISDGVIV